MTKLEYRSIINLLFSLLLIYLQYQHFVESSPPRTVVSGIDFFNSQWSYIAFYILCPFYLTNQLAIVFGKNIWTRACIATSLFGIVFATIEFVTPHYVRREMHSTYWYALWNFGLRYRLITMFMYRVWEETISFAIGDLTKALLSFLILIYSLLLLPSKDGNWELLRVLGLPIGVGLILPKVIVALKSKSLEDRQVRLIYFSASTLACLVLFSNKNLLGYHCFWSGTTLIPTSIDKLFPLFATCTQLSIAFTGYFFKMPLHSYFLPILLTIFGTML